MKVLLDRIIGDRSETGPEMLTHAHWWLRLLKLRLTTMRRKSVASKTTVSANSLNASSDMQEFDARIPWPLLLLLIPLVWLSTHIQSEIFRFHVACYSIFALAG